MPFKPFILKGHGRPLTHVVFNREDDLLFTCAKDNAPQVWFTNNGERLGTFEGHEGAIFQCAVNFDSTRLLTGSGDMTARLWDVNTGKQIFKFKHQSVVRCVAFTEGNLMAATSQNRTAKKPSSVQIFSIDDETQLDDDPVRQISNPSLTSNFTGIVFSPLNESLITSDDSGNLIRWDYDNEVAVDTLNLHKKSINSINYNQDHSLIITASTDMTANLIDARTMEVVHTYRSDRPLNAAAISPILNHVILAGGQDAIDVTLTGAKEGKFEMDFWHIYYEERLASVKGHFGPVNTMAISHNGKMFASGSEDGFVRLHHFDEQYLNSTY